MNHFAFSCSCGEMRPAALVRQKPVVPIMFKCANCIAREAGRPLRTCEQCGEMQPCDRHHVHGRRVSPVMIDLCVNCHRAHHRRQSHIERRKGREYA
jgi:hypothetical protein